MASTDDLTNFQANHGKIVIIDGSFGLWVGYSLGWSEGLVMDTVKIQIDNHISYTPLYG
jgi:hypothetical protein